jgi:hypothetical protein
MTTKDGVSTDASVDAIVQSLATFCKVMPPNFIADALKHGKPWEKRLMHIKPPEVLPSFERLMRNQNQNCKTRANAAHVLLVAAQKEPGAKFDELLSYRRLVLNEEMEDLIFRHKLARILTSFPNLPDELARKIAWFISPLNPRMEAVSLQ